MIVIYYGCYGYHLGVLSKMIQNNEKPFFSIDPIYSKVIRHLGSQSEQSIYSVYNVTYGMV